MRRRRIGADRHRRPRSAGAGRRRPRAGDPGDERLLDERIQPGAAAPEAQSPAVPDPVGLEDMSAVADRRGDGDVEWRGAHRCSAGRAVRCAACWRRRAWSDDVSRQARRRADQRVADRRPDRCRARRPGAAPVWLRQLPRYPRRLPSGTPVHLRPPPSPPARSRGPRPLPASMPAEGPWWHRRSTLVAVVGSAGVPWRRACSPWWCSVTCGRRQWRSRAPRPVPAWRSASRREPSAPVSAAATPSTVPSTTPVPQPSIDPNPGGEAPVHDPATTSRGWRVLRSRAGRRRLSSTCSAMACRSTRCPDRRTAAGSPFPDQG